MPAPNVDPKKQARRERRQAKREKNAKNKSTKPSTKDAANSSIPDSTIGPQEYSKNIKWFLEDERLDPANDPTLQPVVDNFQRESEESFWRSQRDLRDKLASNNMLGGSFWTNQMNRGREEHLESQDTTLAGLYKSSRDQAMAQKLAALDQVNARDIAAGNQQTQRDVARISIKPGMASVGLQRSMWNAQRPWDDMKNLLDVMRGAGDISGYYEYPNYTGGAPPYTGPKGWESALIGGGAGLLDAWSQYQRGYL